MQKIQWVIENVLARSARPGYPSKNVSREEVLTTVEDWQKNGIRSILCLLSEEEQAEYYRNAGSGLSELYRDGGFFVSCVPAEDYKRPPLGETELKMVRIEFDKLEKPVLIHCSAGQDRTGIAVRYLENTDS